ncbi:MAG: sulfite exporter TauE/SafE family protein [Rhodobacteraceae bacterium]|nr:sulfite exporter TauE/SafE family protein [Paracoccaceae bacterium]
MVNVYIIDPLMFACCCAMALIAGVVKGVVGFAMPTILISGLGSLIAPELALAGLILPTLVTNGMQALRQGWSAAADSISRFRVFLLVGLVTLLAAAQLVPVMSSAVMFLIIGLVVTGLASVQLLGWKPKMSKGGGTRAEVLVGGLAGVIGGISGSWGAPTVSYLTAIGTEKTEQMRVQGVIYGLGAVALTVAHIWSGIFNWTSALFSLALVAPAVLGMWIGGQMQDRIDQAGFRRVTLLVLLLAGLNLVRRGYMS